MAKYARPRSLSDTADRACEVELARSASAQRPRAGIFSVYNLFIVYPYFPINKLRLINLKSIFKTPKQSYSVSKKFSSKHRAVIFRHSSVATTDNVLKYNEFTKLGMLLMHLHRMCNNQLIAMPELRFCHTSSPTFVRSKTVPLRCSVSTVLARKHSSKSPARAGGKVVVAFIA